jgi:hypothetical protein
VSLERKFSEVRARGAEALRNNDGAAALDLIAADLIPILNGLETAVAQLQRNCDFPTLYAIAEGLGIKPGT